MRKLTFFIAFLAFASAPVVAAETWTVDPVHSTAQFTAKHFGIVPVIGTIPIVKASVQMNAGSQIPLSVSAELDASQVDTHDGNRDHDLKSDHFFNVAATPKISFVSTKVEGTDPNGFTIAGNLTMHGETHAIVLQAHVAGAGTSPRGKRLVAYAATATIDRTQWGMTYGPLIVGNNVDLSINVEADGP